MIYTLTLNTAVDINISSGPLRPAKINRTQQIEYCPNGKGVNVSLVLKHFNIPSHTVGVFGGFTGRYIVEQLKKHHVLVTPAWVDDPTRINIFINDGQQEYKLVNPGTEVNDESKHQIINHIPTMAQGDYLVISGSLPPGLESRFYSEILSLCQQTGCEVILDISHPILRQLLEFRPLLIKPNDEELAEIFDLHVAAPNQSKPALTVLHELGARHVLLTFGERGMVFSDGFTQWFCPAPMIKLVSSACAGDAALAAFLSVWLNGGAVSEALTLASATGANVAASAGLGQLTGLNELRAGIQAVTL